MQTYDDRMPEGNRGISDALQVVVVPDRRGMRIDLVGELDLASVPEVDRVMEQLAEQGHERRLIDLGQLTFEA